MTEPRTLPGLGLTGYWPAHSDSWKPGMDANLRTLSALVGLAVESRTSALPGSPTNGQIYIVKSDDGTNPNKVALRDDGAWVYLTPLVGLEAWVKDTSQKVRYNGTGWTVIGGSSVSVAVESEGTVVDAGVTSINFTGDGVSVTSDGSGNATVDISGGGSGSGSEGVFTTPPAAATWIQQNFDATKTHLVDFTLPVTGVRLREDVFAYGNTNLLRAAMKAIPGTRWDVKARVRRHTRMTTWNAFGLVIRDSASSRSSIIGFTYESGGIGTINFTNDTTFSAQVSLGGNQYLWRNDIWFRLVYDGTDCFFYTSLDGVYWAVAKKWSATALFGFLTNPATHIGFGYNANNAGGGDLGNELDLLSWEAVSLP